MVVHFILDMLIYVLLCIVYSFCPLEKFVRVASKTRDLMLWCAALSAEKDGCAGSLYGVLGMRERLIIYRNLWLYTHVGVPILVFIAFIKFWKDFRFIFPYCWLNLSPFVLLTKLPAWRCFITWGVENMHLQ